MSFYYACFKGVGEVGLINDQIVKVRSNNYTKAWYLAKGYEVPSPGKLFDVSIEDLQPSSTVRVKVICDYCGNTYDMEYKDYTKKYLNGNKCTCKSCIHKKISENTLQDRSEKAMDAFYKKCSFLGFTPVTKKEEYTNMHMQVYYICPKHGLQHEDYSGFMKSKTGCNRCGYLIAGKILSKDEDEVKQIVESKNNNILLNPGDYINCGMSNLKIRCGSCGNIFVTSLSSIQNSNGACFKCSVKNLGRQQALSISEVEARVNSVGGNILLNSREYISNGKSNLKILCGTCGENIFKVSLSNYEYDGKTRCSICSKRTSQGELIISNFLDNNGISYETEKRFDDCCDKKPLPFDFYLPDYNMAIEFDGQHHFEPIYGYERLEITKKHDNIKNDYCCSHGIDILRIPYYDGRKIESILSRELKIENPKTSKQNNKIKINPRYKT